MDIKRYVIASIFFTALLTSNVNAQTLERDSLYSEFRYFIRLLEETHPDPYNEFGGKIGFHREASRMGEKLKRNDFTLNEYQELLSSFISALRDGHSYISTNLQTEGNEKQAPINFRAYPDGLLVSVLPSEYEEYIGSRLIAINQIPLDSLCKIVSLVFPCENRYGEYMRLEDIFSNPGQLLGILPDAEDSIIVSVQTPDDKAETFTLALTTNPSWRNENRAEVPHWEKARSDEYLYYKYLDSDKQTMYLKMASIMSRECFQAMYRGKWTSLDQQLRSFYKRTLRKEMPENIEDAINGIPVFAATFKEMLTAMQDNSTQNLIIDLRNNGGGWTPITLPTLYMMYGDDYLQKDMETTFCRLLSPLYLQKINKSLSEFNTDYKGNYQLGDYIYQKNDTRQRTTEQKRTDFIENLIGEAGDYIRNLEGKPLYRPRYVYVVTNERTFSAAFHYAFYLWKMGATIVGVPSSQAPNTFMEVTDFELPYTKTRGSFSSSAQYFLPPNDKRARIFWPEYIPAYNDYKKYKFDRDSELLWLLDNIK